MNVYVSLGSLVTSHAILAVVCIAGGFIGGLWYKRKG